MSGSLLKQKFPRWRDFGRPLTGYTNLSQILVGSLTEILPALTRDQAFKEEVSLQAFPHFLLTLPEVKVP